MDDSGLEEEAAGGEVRGLGGLGDGGDVRRLGDGCWVRRDKVWIEEGVTC